MRVVLDTNVVVSAFLSKLGTPARLFQHFQQDRFDLLVFDPILNEYQMALSYPKVVSRHQMSEAQIATVVIDMKRAAIVVTPQAQVTPMLADRDDVKFFACAVAGEAEYIISGDRLVQEVGTYQGIQILSPLSFLTVLDTGLS